MSRTVRFVLLGPEQSWGATFATGPGVILALAALTILLHTLDLATGLRMMLVHGIALEQNPLARAIMLSGGPYALTAAKMAVVLGAVMLFVRTARRGRARLARNCLVLSATVGLLGTVSNLVG
jgi:uncharacterized membrane protein